MAGIRLQVDFFFKNKTPKQVKDSYPVLLTELKKAQAFASKINEGLPNEELTVTAKYHVCRHDEGLPCDEWVEI